MRARRWAPARCRSMSPSRSRRSPRSSRPMRRQAAWRDLGWLTAKPIAHRGLHDAARGVIENCASAFTAAIEAGYAIECDLQLSGDGEAVVFHDETLDRLMVGKGLVASHSAA